MHEMAKIIKHIGEIDQSLLQERYKKYLLLHLKLPKLCA